jgi:hypothetical protein
MKNGTTIEVMLTYFGCVYNKIIDDSEAAQSASMLESPI